MVTIQTCGFMEFLEHNPFAQVPESKEEIVRYVYLYTGKYPVLCHAACNKAFHSKESWGAVLWGSDE